MKHGSLFSGIGGFDLAAEWMGWDNIFHCEINSFGKRILKYYWPKAIAYDDITKTDFTIHRGKIDILTGGFPCQPYSTSGLRKGKDDDRHLWPEMLRAIREIQPRWIVGENVRGLTNWNAGLVFDEVQFDLETIGYEVLPFILPACSVGAPHRRDRVWFISRLISNPGSDGRNRNSELKEGCNGFGNRVSFNELNSLPGSRVIADTLCGKHSFGSHNDRVGGARKPNEKSGWNGFPITSPVCDGDDGVSSRLDGITFRKWRNESIRGGGNAIVPQVVLQVFKAINEYETLF